MKKALTIQDISCVGKCSLTVALPIISAFGIETAILPTAVLSTHTAFKPGFTFRDLTEDMLPIKRHWKECGFTFDALYSGYLGSEKQIDIVSEYFDEYKTDKNFILVDPAMADNGKLYKGFAKDFPLKMAKLCKKADIIVPNLTEACFMLEKNCMLSGYSEEYIKDILIKLCNLGAKKAVISGVSFKDNTLGVYSYDSVNKTFFFYEREKLPVSFHGTGDIFASALTGALTLGKPLEEALKIAVDYTVKCIEITLNSPDHDWYGVEFEKAIPYLIEKIK